jgi:hypothetical protein
VVKPAYLDARPVYQGGLCATHGPVEATPQGRCVLCGQDAPRPDGGAWRTTAVERAHDAALREDAVRAVIATEAVPAPRLLRWRRA